MDDRSERNLRGVNPRLVALLREAVSRYDGRVVVTEGLRTLDRQKYLVASGKSRTINSKHLSGYAFDIALFIDGRLTWDFFEYQRFADVVKSVSAETGVVVRWGGDWKGFVDACHFELA